MHVTGHQPGIDVAKHLREWTEDLDLHLGRARAGGNLNRLQSVAEGLAAYIVCSGSDPALACRPIRIRARAIWAMFARAQYTAYEAWLGEGDNVVFEGTGPTSETYVDRWKDGVACAVLAGDEYCLENMARVPIEIVRASSTRQDEHAYTHMTALQAYLKADRSAPTLVLEALEQTDVSQLKIAPEFCLANCVGEIELLGKLMIGKGDDFDEALGRALVVHHDYWSTDPNRIYMTEGLFPVNLAALATLAIKYGHRVTTTSDYLPRALLEGGCTKARS